MAFQRATLQPHKFKLLHHPLIKPKPIPNSNTQFTKTYQTSNPNQIVTELTFIFTRSGCPVLNNREKLQILAKKLTPQTVQTVLNSFVKWKIAHEFFLWAKEQHGCTQNTRIYTTMVSILCRARQIPELKHLVRDIVDSRCPMTPTGLGDLVLGLGSVGLINDANIVFDQMKMKGLCVPDLYSYRCLLEVCVKGNVVDLVETRMSEMQGLGLDPDRFTFTLVLGAYCNAGKRKEVVSVFNEIRDKGLLDEHVLSMLLVSFSKWGEIDKAFDMFEMMVDLKKVPSEKTIYDTVLGFGKAGRVDKAIELFDRMRGLSFSPGIEVYSVLIEGLCENRESEKALDMYYEMRKCGIIPNVETTKRLISLFCGEGDFVTAIEFLDESDEGFNEEASNMLFNTLLDGLVNGDMIDAAHSLLRDMMGTKFSGEPGSDKNVFKVNKVILLNSASFKIVVDGLCKSRKLDTALRLFCDMIRFGCAGNVLMYNDLINELCSLDRLEEGLELLKIMKESGFKPTQFTHNCIFGCLCKREDVPKALDLIKEMRVSGYEPWIKHTTMLVKQLCAHEKPVEACDFLTGMLCEGFLPDIIAYSATIDGLFKLKKVDMAMSLVKDVSARGYLLDLVAYNILIRGLFTAGRFKDAQDLFEKMLASGLKPSVITYNLMIDGYCKTCELDRALSFLKMMVKEARDPTVVTYTTLIGGLCKDGRPDEAISLWNEMGDRGCSPNRISYMAIIHGLCKCSRENLALNYFQEMNEKGMIPDEFVYKALVSGFLLNKDLSAGVVVIKDLVDKDGLS